MSNGAGSPIALQTALALVRVLALVVPRRRRATWIAEWHGELSYYWRRGGRPDSHIHGSVLRRSLASFPHAVALARQEWSPDSMFQDLTYALRRLRKSPGFSAIAIATMAIGIGANTAIFSVVHSTLINPLPYPDADRIVFLWKVAPDGNLMLAPDAGDIESWRAAGVFEDIQGYSSRNVTMTGAGEPMDLSVGLVSASFFDFLGVPLELGRDFTPDETVQGARVTIISNGHWKTYFGGARDVLGRSITIDGEPHQVVGVLPAGFALRAPLQDARLWLPLEQGSRQAASPLAVARLLPGVTVQAANDALAAISTAKAEEEDNDEFVAAARTPQDMMGTQFATNVWLLQATVGMVLLIACANVANLLLGRGMGQQREMAVRVAIGAGRARLLRQVLVENLVLAGAGGAAGYAIARIGTMSIVAMRPANYTSLATVRVDASMLAFTVLVAVASGLLVGILPALHAARTNAVEQIKDASGTGSASPRRVWLRGAIVVGEVAMSFVLLAGAALLLNSLGRLLGEDLGFDPHNVVTMSVELPEARYPEPIAREQFFDDLEGRIQAALGSRLQSMAVVSGTPPRMGIWFGNFLTEDHQEIPAFAGTMARSSTSTPGFLETMGIPLVDGRDFIEEDIGNDERNAVIVNAAWARAMWGTAEAAGKRFSTETGTKGEYVHYTVVGVIDDARLLGPNAAVNGFVALQPRRYGSRYASIVTRLAADPRDLIDVLKEQIWALDAELPVKDVGIVEQLLADTMASQRFNAVLMSIFAVVALVLAAIGLYGVLSYSVGQRTREIGIRMALGARKANLVPMVVWQGMRLVVLGLAVGVLAAAGLAGYIESVLYEVSGTDAGTYAVVAVVLLAISALACLVPAGRAALLPAMEALRDE